MCIFQLKCRNKISHRWNVKSSCWKCILILDNGLLAHSNRCTFCIKAIKANIYSMHVPKSWCKSVDIKALRAHHICSPWKCLISTLIFFANLFLPITIVAKNSFKSTSHCMESIITIFALPTKNPFITTIF